VKSCLHQPHTRALAVGGAIHDRDHQAAPHATVLSGGVDGDGTDTCNSRPLVKAVTADDSPAPFRDHAEKSRMSEHERDNFRRDLNRRDRAGSCDADLAWRRLRSRSARTPRYQTAVRDGWSLHQKWLGQVLSSRCSLPLADFYCHGCEFF